MAALVALPVIAIAALAFSSSGDVWPHLFRTVLPHAAAQTLLLLTGVGVLTLVIGSGAAWLVTMYRFPGRDMLDWLLILPLAVPAYITAYCYGDLMDYSGPLQSGLRAISGFANAKDYWFPQIRSLGGAIFVLSFVLYPYVYLTARASFMRQSACVLEVARTLGATSTGVFFSVALPLARPALAAGLALVLMECLNDIGAVEYLGVKTFTAAVYETWLQRSSLSGAAQIALVMLVFVMLVLAAERAARRGRRYHSSQQYRDAPRETLTPAAGRLAAAACALPPLLGFALPLGVLIKAVAAHAGEAGSAAYWQAARHSLLLALTAALLTVLLVLVLCFTMRLTSSRIVSAAARLATLGYAVPGTVVAIGLLVPLAALDNRIDPLMRGWTGISTGLLLSGSAFALVLAYTVRFLAAGMGAVEAGFHKISPTVDAAARTLGAGPGKTLLRIHLPLLRPALGAAALLVFVDSIKELPATLLLRPFNFETLATQIYMLASLEQFERAAPAALTIVLIGMAPIILLHRAVAAAR